MFRLSNQERAVWKESEDDGCYSQKYYLAKFQAPAAFLTM